jgi:hypothetical protein
VADELLSRQGRGGHGHLRGARSRGDCCGKQRSAGMSFSATSISWLESRSYSGNRFWFSVVLMRSPMSDWRVQLAAPGRALSSAR